MQLTKKLLSFLNRVFDKDPRRFLALRLSYSGPMTWEVRDAVLTTNVGGDDGLSVDLTQYTIAELVDFLSGQPGYVVPFAAPPELASLGARCLLDGEGDIEKSNGDHLYGYESALWAVLEAYALELGRAARAIAEMLKQMSTTTASDVWLDELGGYYGIPRAAGEADAQYGPRIIAEVLRPRANNIAIENAIRIYTGQSAKVTDVQEWTDALPIHDGAIAHDSSSDYDSGAVPIYGLFDVEYGYDLLNGGDISEFQDDVRALINRLRDAGTHLRSLLLTGGEVSDAFQFEPDDDDGPSYVIGVPADEAAEPPMENVSTAVFFGGMVDAAPAASDPASASYTFTTSHNSLRLYSGMVGHAGGLTLVASLESEYGGA